MSTTRRTSWIRAGVAAVVAVVAGGVAVAAWAGDDDGRDWPDGLLAVPLDGEGEPVVIPGLAVIDDLWAVVAGPNLVTLRTPTALHLIDPVTGRTRAQHAVPEDSSTSSTPVAWGDRAVLRIAHHGGEDELWVVATGTGERLWTIDGDEAHGRPVALGEDTLAVVRDRGEAEPGRRMMEVVVHDGTGAETARAEVPLRAEQPQGLQAVALGGELVLVGAGEAVAVGPDGAVGARASFPGCPSATGTLDGDLLLGHGAGDCGTPVDQVARIDWPTGEEVWRTSSPATPIGDIHAVDGADGPVVLLDRLRPGAGLDGDDGTVLWLDDEVRVGPDGLLFDIVVDDGAQLVRRDPATAEPIGPPVALPDPITLATTRHLVFVTA